jgi:hypothetical protein
MTIRKFLAFSAAAMLLPLATPAFAETIRVGANVTDPSGGAVGTITAVDGQTLMLRTDRHEVRLPVTSFTATDTTVLFGMTQAQLNTAVEQAEAAAAQAFAIGSVLRDSAGVVVGPVRALDADTVTVSIDANVVRVPRAALAAAQGGLVIGATRAQLLAASVPAPPPEPAPAPAPAPAQ